ncbi:MAG: GAF domain-containing protein [Phycisphaerales bacterium]|nr:MAG: GAF domain-containing protein [Phycisphaerales bacterium]
MFEKIRHIFGKPMESDSSLAEFEDTLMLIVDPEQLTNNLLSKLRELTSVEKAFVYLADRSESARTFLAVDKVSREAYKLPELPIDGRIAQWFRTNRQILFFEDNKEVTRYLESDLQPFSGSSVNLALPLISMDRLIGIVFVHLLEGPLNKVQLANLQVLSRQAGLAFENALLFKERLRQNERMFRAEQLATMGQFAAGIAHELRNPLTAIRSTVQYLASEFDEGTDQRKLADDTLDEVDRLNNIVGNLLSLAQPAESNTEEIDVAEQIKRCLGLIEAKAKSQNVRLETDFDSDLPRLTFDLVQLRQLLVNVLMNGLQAMPEGGTLLIRAGLAVEAGRGSGPDSRRMLIEVEDAGDGIAPELRQKVFEPFFTTKPGGTGLGLAICSSIVKQYNGEIWIDKAENGGAGVRISLPVK